MADFNFPTCEEVKQQRQANEDFRRQVQELLDQVMKDMKTTTVVHPESADAVWGYLRFSPSVSEEVQMAVRDAINAVSGGRDWRAELSTSDGLPVLLVYRRQA